jgi:hypothetical protein
MNQKVIEIYPDFEYPDPGECLVNVLYSNEYARGCLIIRQLNGTIW